MKADIYNVSKMENNHIRRIKKADMSEKNKELILKFHRDCALNNLNLIGTLKYLRYLLKIATMLKKDFDKATKEDIEIIIHEYQNKDYAPLTKLGYKVTLKKFYKWLKGNGIRYPKEVEWIKTTLKRTERKLPGDGDLITEEEVSKLIDTANHPRDKAFVSVLYESGCRIGELGSLAIKDVNFDKYGALINVTGKTGPRTIRLISSVPFISAWINIHPLRKDRNSPLWIGVWGRNCSRLLTYIGMYALLRNLFRKAGINKKYNPHIFRHSKATYLANHLTEFQMNQYFGWVQGSDMPSTYVHLSNKDVDEAILELNGIKSNKKETKESKLKPKKCPRCDTVNCFNDKYCSKCACILDIKTAIEIDEEKKVSDKLMNSLMEDKSFWEVLIKKAMENGFSKELIKNIH